MKRNRPGRPRHPDVLTPAEWRVLEVLRDGSTNAEIAARLGISRDTVKYHVSNMLAKLGLDDHRALAAWRPEGRRGRLGAVLAVPAVLWAVVGRPLVWVGLGTAAIAGVAVAVVAAVGVVIAVLVLASGDSDASLVAAPPVAGTAQGTPGPTSALPPSPAPGLCTTPTDPTCIVAVYLGAPADYAQVSQIPAGVLLTPGSDGRYVVERGQQVTVVTAAPLPADWTRFYLQRTPPGAPSPVSAEQLIQPVGTTYTFTVATDEAASTLITFDLKQARPFVRPRPDNKPHIGATVVRTVFSVEATTFRYNRLDTTGAVATPGSYAFLSDPDDTTTAVTTYEALRDGTTTGLIIHQADADGASQAALYDAVETGDLFEWRQADDCFVRYSVVEVKPDPIGDVPKKALSVVRMTFTYTGCSGAIPASGDTQFVWGPMPNLGGQSLTVPVIHGAYEIVPLDWSRETVRDYIPFPDYSDPVETDDITVARTLDFWREPTIPEGWTFGKAIAAGGDAYGGARWGYCATWWAKDIKIPKTTAAHRQRGVEICADFTSTRYGDQDASWNDGSAAHETRVIAGRPASLRFSPPGPNHNPGFPTLIQVFDPVTQVTYRIEAIAYELRSNPEAVVEIALSLFEED